jgi:glycerol-3-phosphate dehydrogenase subunit C
MGAVGQPVKVTDSRTLSEELTRIADICHGCRRCFSLCPSFDVLFKGLDAPEVDGEAGKLPARVLDDFVDLCYECKLCIPHCPYIPPHRWHVDIPHLVLEARRVRKEAKGLPLRERMLSNPDRLGRLSAPVAPIANFVNSLPVVRWGMEKALGISSRKELPRFAGETFTAWFRKRSRPAPAEGAPKVVFYPTCSVEWNRPGIGKAAVQVLERNGAEVVVEYPRCCGMPFFDVGDVPGAMAAREEVVAALLPWVEKGYTVVTPGPSCSLMIRKEYPWLGGGGAVERVAKATRDLLEFLMELKGKGLLATEFPAAPSSIAYHLPCHLKVQNIGFKSRDLLALTGAKVTMVEKCSGHDGTWAMKTEYFGESMKVGQKLFDGLAAAAAEVIASDCPLAGVQIRQGMGASVLHPVEVLRNAYGLPAA